MKSLMTLVILVTSLLGIRAHASYVLVTGSGQIRDDYDATNYLGLGSVPGGSSTGHLYGRTMLVTWMIDLENIAPNLIPTSTDHAVYAGSSANWITTLDVAIDGVSIFDSAFVPNSPSVTNSDHAKPAIHYDYVNSLFFGDQRWLQNSVDLGAGSTLTENFSQRTTLAIGDYREFLTGLNLDQSFAWDSPHTIPYYDAQVNFFQSLSQSSCITATSCSSSAAVDIQLNMWLSTLTAEVVETSVPEPDLPWLFAIGAVLTLLGRRRSYSAETTGRLGCKPFV